MLLSCTTAFSRQCWYNEPCLTAGRNFLSPRGEDRASLSVSPTRVTKFYLFPCAQNLFEKHFPNIRSYDDQPNFQINAIRGITASGSRVGSLNEYSSNSRVAKVRVSLLWFLGTYSGNALGNSVFCQRSHMLSLLCTELYILPHSLYIAPFILLFSLFQARSSFHRPSFII